MAIYTASYFEPANHHGKLVGISRTTPKGFAVHERLMLLAPSRELLADWKAEVINEGQYTERYRTELQGKLPKIHQWLRAIDPAVDATLLCWERAGEFCHRNLAIKLVEHYRPECYGGSDVPVQEPKAIAQDGVRCRECRCDLVPGLDWSYCPSCMEWGRTPRILSDYVNRRIGMSPCPVRDPAVLAPKFRPTC